MDPRNAGAASAGLCPATAEDCERVLKGMSAWPFVRIELILRAQSCGPEPIGAAELKGIPDAWELYELV